MTTDCEKRASFIIPSGETEGFKELKERKERERTQREEEIKWSFSPYNPYYCVYTSEPHALLR